MRSTWNFFTAGQLHFGRGGVRHLGGLVQRLKAQHVLVVTDQVLVRAGALDQVRRPLESAGIRVDVFDGGEPEPSIDAALRAIEFAQRARPQAILGLGGGSNMDLAKIAAAVYTHGGHPRDYLNWDNIPGPICPLICVPTTAGTGSEVSHAAVLTDTANHIKVSTLSNYLRPALAVVDPDLTLTCPAKPTADSGIDALTHAIEAYTAIDSTQLNVPDGQTAAYEGRTPLGDALAEKAVALISQHLRAAVREPQNIAAREGMSLGATLAGMAFSNCAVALVHALEYPLGGAVHCSHGAGNGLLLPYVMRFNLPVRQAAFARLARLLGANVSGMTERDAALAAIGAVESLRRDIGIPLRIRDLGGRPEQLAEFAAKAFAIKRLMSVNPRTPTEADLLGILREAF
jgi:alcohol dehydrogenase class IV